MQLKCAAEHEYTVLDLRIGGIVIVFHILCNITVHLDCTISLKYLTPLILNLEQRFKHGCKACLGSNKMVERAQV
jgi:hypothetical protein